MLLFFIKVSNAHTHVCVFGLCFINAPVGHVCLAALYTLPAHDIGARNARYSEIEREVVVCRWMYGCIACG